MGVKEKLFYFKKKLDFEKSGKELKALPEKSTNSETEVDKQLTGSYQYENNEGLTKSKHNSKQIDEEIEKSMPVSANDENEESQLDQVYIFEQMVS